MTSVETQTASAPGAAWDASAVRRFDFDRDTFGFANELVWAYQFNSVTGKTTFSKRIPKPDYTHRCFVLTRAARQFLYHARFNPDSPADKESVCRRKIRQLVSCNPRRPALPSRLIVFPGFASLREFSLTREPWLKAECGGAWRSYVLRSHWRMVLPISRRHQARTATQLAAGIQQGISPLIHLVRFPKLTINHGMILFAVQPTPDGLCFTAYDPNDPSGPTTLSYNARERTFQLPRSAYWPGGQLDIIEIFRSWWL